MSLQTFFATRKEADNHVLVSIPISLAIDSGMKLLPGELDNNIYQLIEVTHGKHGILYLTVIDNHEKILQATAITNKAILKEFFTNYKAVGTVYKTSSSMEITYTTPDMEEDLSKKTANLIRCMPTQSSLPPTGPAGIPAQVGPNSDCNSSKTA